MTKLIVAFRYSWESAENYTQISAIKNFQATHLVVNEEEKNLEQYLNECPQQN
jgi:16S rRNA C1402 N4-methylase RsmH